MNEIKQKIGLIILAAGESKRLEYFPKQLLKFNEKTFLRNAVENALTSNADSVCVVLGANSENLIPEIEGASVKVVVNENWADGMASSLQKGLRKLTKTEANLDAICIMLCDQPLVDSRIINQLIDKFQTGNSSIVASEYDETIGVPAIFARSLFDDLMSLESSQGAKKIIMENLASVKKISVPEAAFDIDTKQDFEAFLNRLKSLN